MKKIDLHGVKHADVEEMVEDFVLLNELPLKIITGNSGKMKSLVTKVLKEHKFKFTIGDKINQGYITVTG